jgi:hypothetical protein
MEKIELRYFSSFYVDKLYRHVAGSGNFDPYLIEKFSFEETFAKGATGIFIDPDLSLDPSKSDLNNSIILYEALKDLNEVQASDERLWAYLTHTHFWGYMRKRWPIEEAKNPLSRIKERYFLRNLNLEALTRNGLSRLWWYAHITIDTGRQNKYELLEILLQRQDLAVGITERSIGVNKKLRVALLEYLKENPLIATNEDKSRELIKGLNLSGGVKMLPLLEIQEIKTILDKIKIALAA